MRDVPYSLLASVFKGMINGLGKIKLALAPARRNREILDTLALRMLGDQDRPFNYRGWSPIPGDLAEMTSELYCFLATQEKE